MPSEKSARSQEKKRVRNRSIRSATRTTVAKALTALQEQEPEGELALAAAVRSLDKAVSKGILHRNNAARKKSRLMAKRTASKSA